MRLILLTLISFVLSFVALAPIAGAMEKITTGGTRTYCGFGALFHKSYGNKPYDGLAIYPTRKSKLIAYLSISDEWSAMVHQYNVMEKCFCIDAGYSRTEERVSRRFSWIMTDYWAISPPRPCRNRR